MNGTLFFPNSGGDLRSDANQSQIIGGDADEDHSQIIGGMQSNYWNPPGFRHPRLLYCRIGALKSRNVTKRN